MEQLDLFQQIYEPLPKVNHIKLGTFFSGIGAPEKALKRIGIDNELMFFSEIDKWAVKSYCAIHNEDISKDKGDITKINGKDLPYCDMWFGGFPCQDISLAGKQKGFSKGLDSRSSLGWEMIRLLDEVEEKPKYVIFENVANIMSEPMRPTLNLFKQDLEARGYILWNEILNAKDYGIPQNRERYFLVAILGNYYYKFPPKQELKLRLKNMLEDEVDEKYYLSDKILDFFYKNSKTNEEKGNGFRFTPSDGSNIAKTITTRNGSRMDDNFISISEPNSKGFDEARDGDSINLEQPTSKTRRGRVGHKVAQTLNTSCNQGVVIGSMQQNAYIGSIDECSPSLTSAMGMGGGQTPMIANNLRIRKLTPLECYRLMGFDDEDYYKASQVCSNSQLYKQAGNSIVVNVLEAIFRELIK